MSERHFINSRTKHHEEHRHHLRPPPLHVPRRMCRKSHRLHQCRAENGNEERQCSTHVQWQATQWQATFKIVDMGIDISDRKPKDDTSAYNLGKFHTGATIRIAYDTTLNVRQTDNFLSIRMIVGNDTSTVYGVEGLYTVHTVK